MSESLAALREEIFETMQRMRKHREMPPLPKGTTRVEMNVLMMVSAAGRRGQELRPGEIAARFNLTPGAVSQTLKSLEGKGLITRSKVKGDSRAVSIEFTDEGRRLEECGRRIHDARFMEMLEYLGEDDAREFVRIMNRMLEFDETHPWKALCERACQQQEGGAAHAHSEELR